MANPEHVEILKQGVEVWNQWKAKNLKINPDLAWYHLYWADVILKDQKCLKKV
jgi:hypothetical protein